MPCIVPKKMLNEKSVVMNDDRFEQIVPVFSQLVFYTRARNWRCEWQKVNHVISDLCMCDSGDKEMVDEAQVVRQANEWRQRCSGGSCLSHGAARDRQT